MRCSALHFCTIPCPLAALCTEHTTQHDYSAVLCYCAPCGLGSSLLSAARVGERRSPLICWHKAARTNIDPDVRLYRPWSTAIPKVSAETVTFHLRLHLLAEHLLTTDLWHRAQRIWSSADYNTDCNRLFTPLTPGVVAVVHETGCRSHMMYVGLSRRWTCASH